MTGCRVGWLEAPPALGDAIENLVQFTTSGVPVFTQRAAIAALNEGEAFLAAQIARCRGSRDILCEAWGDRPGALLHAASGVLSLLRDRGREPIRARSRCV